MTHKAVSSSTISVVSPCVKNVTLSLNLQNKYIKHNIISKPLQLNLSYQQYYECAVIFSLLFFPFVCFYIKLFIQLFHDKDGSQKQ